MSLEPSVRAGRAIAAMALAGFGAIWLASGCLLSVGAEPGILAAIAAGAGGICLVARRQLRESLRAHRAEGASRPAGARLGRAFHIVNIAQWVAIAVAVVGLARSGHPEWIEAAVVGIVGLHFLPLAAVFAHPRLYLTGGAMIALAIVYPLAAPGGPASPSGCLGAGIILWASAVADLRANAIAGRAA